MKHFKLAILILIATTGLLACKKENQPENQLQTTAEKNLGPNEYLLRGPNGTVVICSGWITKTQPDWSGIGTHEILTDITAPSLSQDVMNSGVVLVYFEFDGKVRLLPFTWFDDVFTETLDFSFVAQNINLRLRFFGNTIAGIGDLRFRYVIIPSNQTGGRSMNVVDYSDYNAMRNYYNIPN
jgi:hypothetical protein